MNLNLLSWDTYDWIKQHFVLSFFPDFLSLHKNFRFECVFHFDILFSKWIHSAHVHISFPPLVSHTFLKLLSFIGFSCNNDEKSNTESWNNTNVYKGKHVLLYSSSLLAYKLCMEMHKHRWVVIMYCKCGKWTGKTFPLAHDPLSWGDVYDDI